MAKRKPGDRAFCQLSPRTKRHKTEKKDSLPAPKTSHTKTGTETEARRKTFILRVIDLLRKHKGDPRSEEVEDQYAAQAKREQSVRKRDADAWVHKAAQSSDTRGG